MARLKLTFDCTLENVRLAGTAVKAICSITGADTLVCSQLELGLVEALNNVIIHACDQKADQQVEIDLTLNDDGIELMLTDRGKSASRSLFDTSDAEISCPPPLAEGGRGLYLIQTLMDEVAYTSQDGVNRLYMCKRRA